MTTVPQTQKARPDPLVEHLSRGERVWAGLSLTQRRGLLAELARTAGEHAAEWVDAACRIKGLAVGSPAAGEEWTTGPYALLTAVAALDDSLAALEAGRSPLDGLPYGHVPGDRIAIRVLPHDPFDRLLLNGFTVDVWCRPGVPVQQLRAGAGLGQLTPARTGGVGVVLGAGNIASIAPLDTLYELFAHNRVVLLKLNPVMEQLLPVFTKVFAPFIDRDLVRIVSGDAELGAALIGHPGVAHVHITGSIASHDAIVFGAGEQGRARKARGEALLDKPITSELGGVSPTIVVPGRWSKQDLRFQAEHVVTQKLHNNGYNCVASQVLVLSSDWPQREAFLAELRDAYDRVADRPAYYPGSDRRIDAALAEHPDAQRLGDGSRLLIDGLEDGDPALETEYFSPVLAIKWLPAKGQQFLDAAVGFANDRLAGTLGANIVVHPRTARRLGAGMTRAIADLRYGTVAVNAWTAVGYLMPRATWGAFPGHTLQDVQSGIGVVHNALLLDHTERSVVRGPFRPFPRSVLAGEYTVSPKPPWFVTNRTGGVTGARLTEFAARPSRRGLLAVLGSALRG